jgi:hypothetical protein
MQPQPPSVLTPYDFVLDVCLMQLPKLVTVEIMEQYRLPVVAPFFVDGMWGPVFSWLLSSEHILGAPDMRSALLARLHAHVRTLRTVASAFEFQPDPALSSELGVCDQLSAGLMVRPQPPSPHTTWEDVVHLLSTCADLASHVRLFASLGQSVSCKAMLLGEMLGVACSEHRGLLARGLFKLPVEGVPNFDALAAPLPGPIFGPCVGWDLRGTHGGHPGAFTERAPAQSDTRDWAASVAGDPPVDPGSDLGPPRHGPIAPPASLRPDTEHRAPGKQRRRRRRDAEDLVEVRPPRQCPRALCASAHA